MPSILWSRYRVYQHKGTAKLVYHAIQMQRTEKCSAQKAHLGSTLANTMHSQSSPSKIFTLLLPLTFIKGLIHAKQ